jgi:uncharacterized paraquat-inducible protein A
MEVLRLELRFYVQFYCWHGGVCCADWALILRVALQPEDVRASKKRARCTSMQSAEIPLSSHCARCSRQLYRPGSESMQRPLDA